MQISIILHQMVQLFVIMGLGYLINRLGMIDADFNKKLTRLILDCTLPLMILASVMDDGLVRDYKVAGGVFLASLAVYVLLPLLSFPLVKLLRIPEHQQGLYMFMNTYSNVGFMGFPIISALYGSTGVFYAAILNIVFNISSFTTGIVLVNYKLPARAGEGRSFNLKKLLTPGITLSMLSIIIYVTGFKVPDDIASICSSLGGVTSPLAMILIGSTLATMDIKSVFNDFRVYIFTFFKLIVVPLIMWGMLSTVISDEMILGVMTVLILMPVANSSVMFANQYGGDEKLAAKTVFISTLASIITVPCLLFIIFG